ncbi:MarR family winged helix-turn-helix transcriptional regulator [Pseudochelatococcus sp. B33]
MQDPLSAGRPRRRSKKERPPYILDDQVGFILRQVAQRHGAIFASRMTDDLTTTQWAVVAKLAEIGPCSQNLLGRLTAMDAATVKGVVDRLVRRGLARTQPSPEDGRRLLILLTEQGEEVYARATGKAFEISEETLAPLSPIERDLFIAMLRRMC